MHKDLKEKVISAILSKMVSPKERKFGVEIESFYYKQDTLERIPVNHSDYYSAVELLEDVDDNIPNGDQFSLSLIHISSPRDKRQSRMPSSA